MNPTLYSQSEPLADMQRSADNRGVDVDQVGVCDLAYPIIVLDRDLQVVWTWDAFDHLDVHRAAPQGDECGPVGSTSEPPRRPAAYSSTAIARRAGANTSATDPRWCATPISSPWASIEESSAMAIDDTR